MALKFSDLPFISFPEGWEIKIMDVAVTGKSETTAMVARFAVQKAEAKNIVSVALFNTLDDPALSLWEVAPLQLFGNGTCGIYDHECSVHLDDVPLLLHSIEKCFDMEVDSEADTGEE
jgi:hypothetical protein